MRAIPRYLWARLRLGEGTRAVDAAMCFYLGKGVEETHHLLDGRGFGELDDVRELAGLNGFNAERDCFINPFEDHDQIPEHPDDHQP